MRSMIFTAATLAALLSNTDAGAAGAAAKATATPAAKATATPVAKATATPVAQATATPAPTSTPTDGARESIGRIQVSALLGAIVPQGASNLSTAAATRLDAGFRVGERLSPLVSLTYTQPESHTTLSDTRVTGGKYSATTRQQQIDLGVGAVWRFLPPMRKTNFYGGGELRLMFLQTGGTGSAGGASFLRNTESSTRPALALLSGVEHRLGPGSIVGEFDVGFAQANQRTAHGTDLSLALSAGYRIFFH